MTKTERKYWVNGYQERPRLFYNKSNKKIHKCLTFSVLNIGVLITNKPTINIYQLV
jgi:hypothetical protein